MSEEKSEKNPEQEEKKYVAKRWIDCPVEQEFFGEERKADKQMRKLATSKDRSKYKKTDREKHQKSEELHKNMKLSKEQLLKGRVLSINPEGIIVEHEEKTVICTLRGLLKKEKGQFKNLVTVGDIVLFETGESGEGLIAHVEPRRTVLSRADNLSRRKEQLIAANIDQVIITGSVVFPPLKPSLLDRYIIAARKGGLEPLIIINKIDLLKDDTVDENIKLDEQDLYEHLISAYQNANIPVIAISAVTGEGLDLLEEAMKGKASVFSGQSGVGKSSLINAVTGTDLKIGSVVERTKKGSHTTTSAQLLPLKFGGWCIDTPGIKSFGLWDLKKEEIKEYFSEIYACGSSCWFSDCSHSHEEGCAVIVAVEKGEISPVRYQSYLSLIETLSEKHYRR